MIAMLALVGCVDPEDELGTLEQDALISEGTMWNAPGFNEQRTTLDVCFEPTEWISLKPAIRDGVEMTWGVDSPLTFRGWYSYCNGTSNAKNLRIKIRDLPSGTNGQAWVGTANNHVVDAVEIDYAQSATRAESTSAHELGHALGYQHEHLRPHDHADHDPSCPEPAEGSVSATPVGPYDLWSVMNYCNSVAKPLTRLGSTDIMAANIYGAANPVSISSDATQAHYVIRTSQGYTLKRDQANGNGAQIYLGAPQQDIAGDQRRYNSGPTLLRIDASNMHVFARFGSKLAVRSMTNGVWSAWNDMFAPTVKGDAVSAKLDANRYAIAIRGTNGVDAVRVFQYQNGAWSFAKTFGLAHAKNQELDIIGNPSLATIDGNYWLFATWSDHKIRYLKSTGTTWPSWDAWTELAETAGVDKPVTTVVMNSFKCPYLYAFYTIDTFLYYKRIPVGPLCFQSPWSARSSIASPPTIAGTIAGISRANDVVDLFMKDENGDIYTVWGGGTSFGLAKLTGAGGQSGVTAHKAVGNLAVSGVGNNVFVVTRATKPNLKGAIEDEASELMLRWTGSWTGYEYGNTIY